MSIANEMNMANEILPAPLIKLTDKYIGNFTCIDIKDYNNLISVLVMHIFDEYYDNDDVTIIDNVIDFNSITFFLDVINDMLKFVDVEDEIYSIIYARFPEEWDDIYLNTVGPKFKLSKEFESYTDDSDIYDIKIKNYNLHEFKSVNTTINYRENIIFTESLPDVLNQIIESYIPERVCMHEGIYEFLIENYAKYLRDYSNEDLSILSFDIAKDIEEIRKEMY